MGRLHPSGEGHDARLIVLADVGGSLFHVGDEAMLEANVLRLEAAAPAALVSCLGSDATDDAVVAAIASADGVLISGGGNMSSSWPDLLDQRVLAIGEAARRGVPVVLGGQTIGPGLTQRQRGALAQALASVACVGVRDAPSAALAAELGAPLERIHYQVDDAFLLHGCSPHAALVEAAVSPYLAITLDASFGAPGEAHGLEQIGEQVAAFAAAAGVNVVVLPHVGPLDEVGDEDGAPGRALGALLESRGVGCTVAPVLSPSEAAWLARSAAAVISSRYHPIVFALGGSVPCIGIYRDAYTRVKLRGGLAHFGLQDWTLPAADAQAGQLAPMLEALWPKRGELRRLIHSARKAIERREQHRWHQVLDQLGLHDGGARPPDLGPSVRTTEAQTRSTAPGPGKRRAAILDATRGGAVFTEDDFGRFSRDGFLHLGQVLDTGEVEALRSRADELALGKVRNEHVMMQLDTGGAYEELPDEVARFERGTHLYRKIQGLEQDDLFRPLVLDPMFLGICARIYGEHAPVSIFRAMVMNKPAGQGTVLPWHQDGGDVWKLDRDPLVTIWVALDDASTANGCMEAVRGSHLKGLLTPEGSNISEEHAAIHCPPESVVALEVPAGHAVLLHNWLIHRSGVNPSPEPRRAVTVCYMDGRTMSVLTGNHFPIVAGAISGDKYPFVEQLESDRASLTSSLGQAEEYVESLRTALERTTESFRAAEEYAQALGAEVDRLNERCRFAEEYSASLERESAH